MPINITPEIKNAHRAYLDEPVGAFVDGRPILRRDTFPFESSDACSLVDFAAGFQAGAQPAPSDGRWVPMEPTQAMVEAGGFCANMNHERSPELLARYVFSAMISAAPAAQPADSAMEAKKEAFACPICNNETPHDHPPEVLAGRDEDAALWRKWAPYMARLGRKPFNLTMDLERWLKTDRARALTAASKERSKTHE